MTISRILATIILLWIFVYSSSYGIWTWRKDNKLGSFAVLIVSLITLILPLYVLYFRT